MKIEYSVLNIEYSFFPIKQNKENISIKNLTFISLYRQRNEPKKATRNVND